MTFGLKAICFAEVALLGIAFGVAAGSGVTLLAEEQLGSPRPGSPWFVFWPCLGIVLGVVAMSQWLRNTIGRSRERLTNDEYAAMLLRLGLAKKLSHGLVAGASNASGTNYLDEPAQEVARDYAIRLAGFFKRHRDKQPR